MDPVSHVAMGLLVAQLTSSPADSIVPQISAVLASQIPDLDFITKKFGDSTFFLRAHHKLSHSLVVLTPICVVLALIMMKVSGYHYAFSPDITLYMAKVVLSSTGEVISEEFRERWEAEEKDGREG